jgi:hypothetical protein
MSKWTANCLPGVLKRTPEYDAFVKRNSRAQAWKRDQIHLLKKRRAIEARLKSRADTINSEAVSTHNQIKTSA